MLRRGSASPSSRHWEWKKAWYQANHPGQPITTEETATLSQETKQIIASTFGVEAVDVETP